VFKHSGGPFGENLSAGTHPFSIPAAIKLWTDEEPEYNPSNPDPSHYTQVVWKGSKQVGCALASCSNLQGAFAVCLCFL
jgi:pathogenesis-related protein 1